MQMASSQIISMIAFAFLFLLTRVDGGGEEDHCFVPMSDDWKWDTKVCVNNTSGEAYMKEATDSTPDLGFDIDTMFFIFCGILVFFMQTGFAMLEAGAVHLKNIQNILYKNLMDASLGCIVFYLFGFAFAFGGENDNAFIGSDNFALTPGYQGIQREWFFQYCFAATAATIVSGSVAERCRLYAYFVYATLLTLWVYPVVVHWAWDHQGWLYKFGFIDFAGSGVVHLVGGTSGFFGATLLGPRWDTFDDETFEAKEKRVAPQETLLQSVGTTFLWFGWYGFNCGSALGIVGKAQIVGRVALCSTLSAASSGLTSAFLGRMLYEHHSLGVIFNSILCGFVSICASVSIIEPYMAIFIGIGASIVYNCASRLVLKMMVDDPLDATAVHAAGGMWGLLCPGIFASPRLIEEVYGRGVDNYSSGKQFGIQLLGLLCIFAWAAVNSIIIFGLMKKFVGLRVPIEIEKLGLDSYEHGGLKLVDSTGHYKSAKLNAFSSNFGVDWALKTPNRRSQQTDNSNGQRRPQGMVTAIVPKAEFKQFDTIE